MSWSQLSLSIHSHRTQIGDTGTLICPCASLVSIHCNREDGRKGINSPSSYEYASYYYHFGCTLTNEILVYNRLDISLRAHHLEKIFELVQVLGLGTDQLLLPGSSH